MNTQTLWDTFHDDIERFVFSKVKDKAITDDLVLDPDAHVGAMRDLTFSAISGTLTFDPETGSRLANSATYKVANYREEQDDEGMVIFQPVLTDLFQNSEWNSQDDYIFNDGTTNLPPDKPLPAGDSNMDLPILIGGAAAIAAILGVIVFLFYENKRKKNDSVWQVKKGECAVKPLAFLKRWFNFLTNLYCTCRGNRVWGPAGSSWTGYIWYGFVGRIPWNPSGSQTGHPASAREEERFT